MKIAVEGCAHGELDNIYSAIEELEQRQKVKVDLLICCGDFQSSRNVDDLACMAVPPKYRHMCSFYKYFSGEAKAPLLTIFIGGNHEASNYLQELPYGGWVAPNIYYVGYAGVINIAGIRIGGISGIYKSQDYMKGRYEKSPYDENSKRSVYHIRNLEVFRLKQLSQPMDIFLSHDWPSGVYHHGNVKQLLKRKPFFKDEIETNQLGSKPCEQLLNHLKPKHWFSAHLHCKFTAEVPHEKHSPTKFLALDKCLPRRQFLQIVDVPHSDDKSIEIEYDLEWLTVLYLTNHLLNVRKTTTYMPGPGGNERYNFSPTENEKNLVLNKLHNNLKVPLNFKPTAAPYKPGSPTKRNNKQPEPKLNPQTVEFCELLGVDDPMWLISESSGLNISLDTSFLEEDTTFIHSSDSEDSDGNNDSKTTDLEIVEQESKMKDMQLPDSKKQVTPMKLPQPKISPEAEKQIIESDSVESSNSESNTSSDVNLNTSTQKNEDENLSSSTELPKTSPKRTFSEEVESQNSEISASSPIHSDSSLPTMNCDTPTPKKFKRRNASIYGVENSTATTS